MLLTDHAVKVMGAPLAGENLIAHKRSNRTRKDEPPAVGSGEPAAGIVGQL